MIFLELFVPRRKFGPDELRELAERLTLQQLLTHVDAIRDVVDAGEAASADPGVMAFMNSINHVVVHEIGTWVVDGRALGTDEPPRYVVRVSVPGPWRKAMSPFLIASITRALAQVAPDPEQCYREPRVEVQVIGVPEGGYGVFGRVVGESALLDLISDAKSGSPASGDPGLLVDPVCGMIASDMVVTLEHDGTTYGFCSAGCRRHFADKLTREDSR